MSYVLSVKDKQGNNTEVEIDAGKGISNAVKELQTKVSALEYRNIKTSSTARLPHAIGEKVFSSVPLDVYGYIKFDGRKIYSYDEYGDFYNHIKSIYDLLNSEKYIYQLEKNYDLIGTPTDNYGKISGFTHSQYARAKKVLNFSTYDAWRVEFYIKMGTEVLSDKTYTILGRDSSTYSYGLLLIIEGSKFKVWYKNLSGTWGSVEGKTVLAPNTEYLVRVTFVNGKLILSTKVINVEGAIDQYFKEFEVDAQNYPDSFIRFGDDYNGNWSHNGEIDLNRMRFYDLTGEDLSDLDIFFTTAPCFYKPSEMLETFTKQGFIPESVYEKELEKFGKCNQYVLNEEEQYVRIPLHTNTDDNYLLYSYSKGSDFIRIYRDGWCEQGGTSRNESTSTHNNFLIPFVDTNYTWLGTTTSGSWISKISIISKTTSYVTLWTSDDSSFNPTNLLWKASGYINLKDIDPNLELQNVGDDIVINDNFEYLCVANGVQNITLDRNDELTVNNPFTLLESKYSRTKLNNISWLRYEGETLTKEKYPSAYKYLTEQRTIYDAYQNFQNREDTTDFDNAPDEPDIIVKLISEDHSNTDYVLDQENNTFTLPIKSESSYLDQLVKNDAIIHQSTVEGVSLKIYASGYTEQEGTITLASGESGNINYLVPINSSTIFLGNGIVTAKDNTSCTVTNIEGEISYRISGYVSDETLETYKPEYKENDLYLYYFMGDTAQNLSLVNIGKLSEDYADAKNTFKKYGNILEEVQGHTTKFSKTIAKTQVSKAVESLVSQIKLRDVYTENMNELFLLPDPYYEGSQIKLKTYNFAVFADGFQIFDEYSKRLYLLDIRYSEHYSELPDENGDYNLSYDVYFTYDKSKEMTTNVINEYSGDVTNLPDYDSKARLKIKVYGEDTINFLNTPDGGENVYSGYVLKIPSSGNTSYGLRSDVIKNDSKLARVPEQTSIENIHNRHISELLKLFRGEEATNLPLGEMELTFSGLRVSKVQGNFRNAPYGYAMSCAEYYSAHGYPWKLGRDIRVYNAKYALNNEYFIGPYLARRNSVRDGYADYADFRVSSVTAEYISSGNSLYEVTGNRSGYWLTRNTNFTRFGVTPIDNNWDINDINSRPFANRMSEFSMTVMNRYGSKTIVYDKTNVDQSKNNPCVFDFTEEMVIDPNKEIIQRSDFLDFKDQTNSNYEEFTTQTNTKYDNFTAEINETVVQYENNLDTKYENSIVALDTRETEHYTEINTNHNNEVTRAQNAENTIQTTLQTNIDTVNTNQTDALNAYKNTVNEQYSKVKVVDHIDKCTEDNIIYLVDPTWNVDYETQTYEDVEIKNLTHD